MGKAIVLAPLRRFLFLNLPEQENKLGKVGEGRTCLINRLAWFTIGIMQILNTTDQYDLNTEDPRVQTEQGIVSPDGTRER